MIDFQTLAEKIIAVEGSELYAYFEGLSNNNNSVVVARPIILSFEISSCPSTLKQIETDTWERRTLIGGQRAWVKIRR